MAEEIKDDSGISKDGEVKQSVPKTYTTEEVNDIVSGRVNELKAKQDKAIEDAVKKALKEQSERQRIESLQGEERLKAEYQAQLESLQAERTAQAEQLKAANLALAISKAEAQLASLGLPTEFADKMIGANDRETAKNIETFNAKVNELVTAKVNDSLARGGPQIGTVKTDASQFAEIDKAMSGRLF